MHILKKFFTLFSLLSISFCANAVTSGSIIHSTSNTLGSANPDSFVSSYIFSAGDIIDDIYLFDINPSTATSLLSTTATSIELGSSFGISNFKFAFTDNSGVQMSNWGQAGESIFFTSMTTAAPVQVNTGTYGIHFTGTVTGSSALITNIVAIAPVTAVPVPAAVWLFSSALIGLAGVSRSRRTTI